MKLHSVEANDVLDLMGLASSSLFHISYAMTVLSLDVRINARPFKDESLAKLDEELAAFSHDIPFDLPAISCSSDIHFGTRRSMRPEFFSGMRSCARLDTESSKKAVDGNIFFPYIEYDGHPVTCGTELNCSITRNMPTKVSFEADETKCYTLIMFDPDYPSRQNFTLSCFRHWLLENIEGGLISNGIEISPYHPPDSPAGSGFHRYLFLVYEQPENSELYDFCDDSIRTSFDVAGFVQERNLQGPVAGNFFLLQN
ncbi:protein D1 [Caerostris darwini]|uniref:Protein D1 n=1 Tax=Caerostris darwini TaxID=1538125 RepID=A0AAV4NM18_9ARAC|nr:protein D1 [Caerostris darwini]